MPTDEGAEITMFCNPQAKIGGIINLTSETLTGRYRIVGVRFSLDNWQGSFVTWTDCREL